ncbi:hypothetical protein DFQ26_000113 [Actinomortierella ambigua]|nr:hypothetical protein DFQ26_000113 [Actinomortierella ambigua]
MKIIASIALTMLVALIASAAPARTSTDPAGSAPTPTDPAGSSSAPAGCSGIEFTKVRYHPSRWVNNDDFDIIYTGKVTRKVDKDVNVHTIFYDKHNRKIYENYANWCKTLEDSDGECPMSSGDKFNITFPHLVDVDNVHDYITIETKAVGRSNACYGYHKGKVDVDEDDAARSAAQ